MAEPASESVPQTAPTAEDTPAAATSSTGGSGSSGGAIPRKSVLRKDFTLRRQETRKEETRIITLEVAQWVAQTLGVEDVGEKFLDAPQVQSGVWLCNLISRVDANFKLDPVHPEAKPNSFPARDNIKNFIDAAMRMGVPKIRQIEAEDLVARRNLRNVLYFILGLAKQAYLTYGVKAPDIVAMELEIDELKKSESERPNVANQFQQTAASLDHVPYVPVEGDEIDEWIARYVNENRVPAVATPTRLPIPPTGGQYIFSAEPAPHQIYYVRMVRHTPLVRVGQDWEELASLIQRKMRAAFEQANKEMPELKVPETPAKAAPAALTASESVESNLDSKEDVVQEAVRNRKLLAAIEKDNVMYVAGKDAEGRAVLVVIGSRIPPTEEQRLYHLLLYLALVLDQIGRQEYVVVYCHTRAHFETKFFGWIRKARDRMPYIFKKNLYALHIVHPSFFIKACFAFMRPFISGKFWKKLTYYSSKQTEKVDEPLAPLKAATIFPSFVLLHHRHQNEGKLFGGSLETAQKRNAEQSKIPRVCYETVEFLRACALDTEGLFRVSDSTTAREELQKLYEDDDDVRLFRGDKNEEAHHVAAGLLKAYLRELEEPLLPFAQYDRAVELGAQLEDNKLNDESAETVVQFAAVLKELPELHRVLLQYLLEFLQQVAARAEKNKMKAANLAIVFAPNLIRKKDETPELILDDSGKRSAFLTYTINHCQQLFPDPLDLS